MSTDGFFRAFFRRAVFFAFPLPSRLWAHINPCKSDCKDRTLKRAEGGNRNGNGKRTYTKPTAEMLEINYVETVTASNGSGASGG